MKRFSLWFAVAFVLFAFQGGFAKPTRAQLDSLEAQQPALDTTANVIQYDSLETYPELTAVGADSYWIAVQFTPIVSDFKLQVVYLQVDNPLINYTAGCSLIVADDASDNPGTIRLSEAVGAPLPNRLRSVALSETLSFALNQKFWILLGPVPGGPDNDEIGNGWWGKADSTGRSIHSYIRFKNSSSWVQFGQGNWILRAGGAYGAPPDPVINEVMFNADRTSSDSVRNHEWVELYNPAPSGTFRRTQGWKLTNGGGPFFPAKSVTLPDFPFRGQSYLVVHFATGVSDSDYSDGRGDIYTGSSAEFFGDMIDACALLIPGHQPSDVTDAVAWNLKNLSTDPDSAGQTYLESGPSFNPLNKVTRTRPVGGIGPLLTANKGVSIGRDKNSFNPTTSSNGQNLALLGGKDAAGPTMGKQNYMPMVVDTSGIQNTAVSNANWTIMLYFAADYGSGPDSPERWGYDILNQIERQLPANLNDSKANVLVWFDSRRAYPKGGDTTGAGTVFRGILRHDLSDTVKNLVQIGDQNSGDSASLRSFITWARDSFPASRYVLALKGDGAGWEGLCGDARRQDRLDMTDLKEALKEGLGADTLELLIFDASLMSQLEVATQVSSFAHSMVASPEMTGPEDFDYSRLAGKLGGGSLAVVTSDSVAKDAVASILEARRTSGDKFWTWVALRLQPDSLGRVLDSLNRLASNLLLGTGDICAIGRNRDNFQLYVRDQLRTSDHYGGQAGGMADFVDVKSLCFNLYSFPESLTCASGHRDGAYGVYSLLRTVEGAALPPSPVLLATSLLDGSGKHYGNAGVSIYFPSSRQHFPPIPSAQKRLPAPPVFRNSTEHPFDTPGLASEGGTYDMLRMYARDTSACYPHAGGSCTGDTMAWYYPHPVVRDFNFVNRTRWDEFLIRYYKPVADAGPEQLSGHLNVAVTLDASGSSDADDELSSLKYYWDLFYLINSPLGCDETEREDLDKNCVDDATDDRDTAGISVQYSFQNSGKQPVWLHVWDDYDGSLSGTNRGYHTAKDSSVVVIEFQGVQEVYETASGSSTFHVYDDALIRLAVPNRCGTSLPDSNDRKNILNNRLSSQVASCPTVIWTIAAESVVTFPSASQVALDSALRTDNMSAWICAPLLGKDAIATKYFKGKLLTKQDTFSISSVRFPARYLAPAAGSHFLSGLPHLELDTTLGIPQLQALQRKPTDTDSTTCPTFPILVADNGDTVAVARVLEHRKHAIVYSTFSLEQLADTNDIDLLVRGILGWLASPDATNSCLCATQKGDLNGDGSWTATDVTLMLNCVFTGSGAGTMGGDCNVCYSDVNCSGDLSATDVTLELSKVFGGSSAPPWCGP